MGSMVVNLYSIRAPSDGLLARFEGQASKKIKEILKIDLN
jgi:hypothetical protein